MHFSTFAVAAFAAVAIGIPLDVPHKLHEKRDFVPKEWVKGRELRPQDLLPVRIGMTQQRLDEGHDLLMEVSDHTSPKYGQWYTEEEITELFAPSQESVDKVREWVHSAGIEADRVSQSMNKQWMQFDATVEELARMLKTKYHAYTHVPSGKEHVACDEYHIPEHVQEHVDYITPGIKLYYPGKVTHTANSTHVDLTKRQVHGKPPVMKPLPIPISQILAAPELSLCGTVVTPPCIRALYNVPSGAPAKYIPGNDLGIFESLGDHYSPIDLDLFFTAFASNIPLGTKPTFKGVDGATGPAPLVLQAGPESDLDFQLAYPLIYPQKTVLFQTDDEVYQKSGTPGFLNTFFDAIDGSYCNFKAFGINPPSKLDPHYPHKVAGGYKGKLQCGKYEPTNVISISYGGNEADLPVNYQRRQCAEIMKLGMRGVSVIVASGDSGVAGASGCIGNKGGTFNPDFPASCPYITAVGSTVLPTGGDAQSSREVATSSFPSGGGFSNIYPRPSYQQKAVNTYLTKHKPKYDSYTASYGKNIGPGQYNRAGRGYPDVGAAGDNIVIFNKGIPTLIGGTSAACPIFASLLTKINEERLKKGKKTVGFVNPTLYAHSNIFNPVASGSNPGCNTNGFSVAPGWNPVTGLGTPNYKKLLKVFMSMP